MSDCITLSRAALEAAISAALLQESYNSFLAGSEGSSLIDENQAGNWARRIVDQVAATKAPTTYVCFHCGAENPVNICGDICGYCGGNN